MKIAVWYNLPSGGSKRALYDHVRGLIKKGHTLEVWCPPSADRAFLPLATIVKENVVPLDWRGNRRLYDAFRFTSRFDANIAAMNAHSRECAKQMSDGNFDVLFANTCRFYASPFIGRHANIPSALYLAEPCRSLYEAMPTFRWSAPLPSDSQVHVTQGIKTSLLDIRSFRNARVQVREEAKNAASFGKRLVNSMFSRESILRAYGLNSEVCYLGIDTSHFRDFGWDREGFVLGLGSFQPAKNIRLVIEALSLMQSDRPKLVWIGNSKSSYLEEMIGLASDLKVKFEPHLNLTDQELLGLMNRASAMVYAPRLEPFGLAPLEAGACGVPVIAVAEGGVRETVVDGVNGLLVEDDPLRIAEALTTLMSDKGLASRLRAEAALRARRLWSLEQAIDRLEVKLMQVAAKSPVNEVSV